MQTAEAAIPLRDIPCRKRRARRTMPHTRLPEPRRDRLATRGMYSDAVWSMTASSGLRCQFSTYSPLSLSQTHTAGNPGTRTMPDKHPKGSHNPSQKSLQRWDNEGGAPKGAQTSSRSRPARQAHDQYLQRRGRGSATWKCPHPLVLIAGWSYKTTFNKELWTSSFPLYSINPNLRNLFMKKLTRDRVVPIISARVS